MTTRRKFLAGLAISPLAARTSFSKAVSMISDPTDSSSTEQTLFVGTGTQTGSKGIYAFRFRTMSGALEPLGLAAEAPSPSFLAVSPDGKTLFAVNEIDDYQAAATPGRKTGAVSSYAIDRSAGKLKLINTVASGGAGPCHLSTDQTGKVLLVANYTGGSASSFRIGADGRLSDAISNFHYPSTGAKAGQDKDRQEAAHAHHATTSPENRYVYINDLGLDCIHIYRLDAETATLTANSPGQWVAATGSGPRVLRFHPMGKWAYCVDELASTIDQLSYDSATGALTLSSRTELLTKSDTGISRAAEIIFTRDGRFAYVANRDNDFLGELNIDPATGKLSGLRRTPSGGKIPRHIALDPSERWLLAANQESNLIAVFGRNETNGHLEASGPTATLQSPQCLLFV